MTRDWGGLGGIVNEAHELERSQKAQPLVDCPICGTVLDVNTRNERNCPLGHYRTTARTLGEAGLA